MLRLLRLRYCRAHMNAYLDGTLSDTARRRVARYIDSDPACYAEYMRQRTLRQDLIQTLPRIGRPPAQRLDALWSAIQAEIAPQTIHSGRPMGGLLNLKAAYGFVGMAAALLLMLPLSVGGGQAGFALPQQPQPRTQVVTATASFAAREVAFNTATPQAPETLMPQTAALILRVTPTPQLNAATHAAVGGQR